MCFHPTETDTLSTGSTDGLVCVFDISQPTEDDAITLTLNSESSVVKTQILVIIYPANDSCITPHQVCK